jgi:hypothetical protein
MRALKLFLITMLCSTFAYSATIFDIQAVDSDGYGTHPYLYTTNKVIVEGVIINRPDYMLNSNPDENAQDVGAQWQMFIQGDPNTDHAGVALWMGQCYDNTWGGDGTYTDTQWASEMWRLSRDDANGYQINVGDKIRVTGLLKFYRGKTNINERHSTEPENDIQIELIEAGAGLPWPEDVNLADLKNQDDTFTFDPSRLSGCEFYQGRLIRLTDVYFTDPNWAPCKIATVTDPTGRTFNIEYGRGPGFTNFDPPAGTFDVVGILNQESSDMDLCKDGYSIWVSNYDGNQALLSDRGLFKNRLDADVNIDGIVDMKDLAILCQNWLKQRTEGF